MEVSEKVLTQAGLRPSEGDELVSAPGESYTEADDEPIDLD